LANRFVADCTKAVRKTVASRDAPAADTPHKIHKTPKIHLTIFPNNFIISPQLIKNN